MQLRRWAALTTGAVTPGDVCRVTVTHRPAVHCRSARHVVSTGGSGPARPLDGHTCQHTATPVNTKPHLSTHSHTCQPHLLKHSHTGQHTATPVNTQPHCQHTATPVDRQPHLSVHRHTCQHTAAHVNTQPHLSTHSPTCRTHSHTRKQKATPLNIQPHV